jgi:hypothetical protein
MAVTLHLDYVSSENEAVVGPTPGITRATKATFVDASGVIQEVNAGVKRRDGGTFVDADTVPTGTSNGLLVEEARTNIALHSGDISNAVWVASNVTKGTDSVTDPMGAANTNVRLTATAGNGTLLQSVTSASATRSYAVYMKRVTGTGNIDLTVDGGTTWTTKTLTSEWQRFDITQAAVTNPQIGVRIVTSGDAIDFWGSDLQTGSFTTSHIPTTTASVTRNADIPKTTDVSWYSQADGTFFVRAQSTNISQVEYLLSINDNTFQNRVYVNKSGGGPTKDEIDLAIQNAAGENALTAATSNSVTENTEFLTAAGYATDDAAIYTDGIQTATDTLVDPPSGLLTFDIGHAQNDTIILNGLIKEIRYYNTRLTNTQLEDMSNGTFPSFGLEVGSDDWWTWRRKVISAPRRLR